MYYYYSWGGTSKVHALGEKFLIFGMVLGMGMRFRHKLFKNHRKQVRLAP